MPRVVDYLKYARKSFGVQTILRFNQEYKRPIQDIIKEVLIENGEQGITSDFKKIELLDGNDYSIEVKYCGDIIGWISLNGDEVEFTEA